METDRDLRVRTKRRVWRHANDLHVKVRAFCRHPFRSRSDNVDGLTALEAWRCML
jgi:hypothetical protein